MSLRSCYALIILLSLFSLFIALKTADNYYKRETIERKV